MNLYIQVYWCKLTKDPTKWKIEGIKLVSKLYKYNMNQRNTHTKGKVH